MNKDNLKNSELRSTGVQNLLNKNPDWFILKGNFFISIVLIISLSIMCYYVKYLEFINSKVTIDSFKIKDHNKFITGRLTASQNDLNKIQEGQKVIVKLYDFPYQEYGVLSAQIQETSINTKNPHINIIFPKGLKTSYNKNILFDKELKGNAEIIVQDTLLITKIFHQITKIMY